MVIIRNEHGHTLLEVVISTIVFSLIMLTITALLSIGLKTWQIGETQIDNQNSAQVALNRMKSELNLTCKDSCVFAKDAGTGQSYIAFDSATDSTGHFNIDNVTRTPQWQVYIIYYTFRNPDDKFMTLYRKEKTHYPFSVAGKPVIGTPLASDFALDMSGNPRIMAKSVKDFEVTKTGDLLNIHLICARNIGDRKLPYEQDFDAQNIEASIDLLTVIYPRN